MGMDCHKPHIQLPTWTDKHVGEAFSNSLTTSYRFLRSYGSKRTELRPSRPSEKVSAMRFAVAVLLLAPCAAYVTPGTAPPAAGAAPSRVQQQVPLPEEETKSGTGALLASGFGALHLGLMVSSQGANMRMFHGAFPLVICCGGKMIGKLHFFGLVWTRFYDNDGWLFFPATKCQFHLNHDGV